MKLSTATLALALASQAAMPTVTLNTGTEMPAVSLGVWKYNSSYAGEACKTALANGYNAIDTAYDYDNQDAVGAAINAHIAAGKATREEIFLTTKIPACGSFPVAGLPTPSKKNCGPDSTTILEKNLKLLNLEYVDLVLLHFPPESCGGPFHPDACRLMQEQWTAMEAFYQAGKAKAIGVSNYCQSCFECLKKMWTVVPALNQVQYHVGEGADPIGLKSYCDELGIQMMAYSALSQGSSELITGNLTTGIGKQYGKSGAQVALKYIVQHGWTLTTKAHNPKYQAEDIDIFDFTLSDDDMKALDDAPCPGSASACKPSFFCSS